MTPAARLTLLLALGVAEQRALVGRLAALFGATPGFEAHAQLPPAVRVPSLRLRHAELGGGHAAQGVGVVMGADERLQQLDGVAAVGAGHPDEATELPDGLSRVTPAAQGPPLAAAEAQVQPLPGVEGREPGAHVALAS